VLVAVTAGPEPGVVLTVRSRELLHHAGQVAFPGGARDTPDESVVDTAMREAREEAGIDQGLVHPLGYLGRYDTISGYRMTAVVAMLEAEVRLAPDRNEVDAVFTVPLCQVCAPECYRRESVAYGGRQFEIITLEHPEHRIWGATAALLHEFGSRMQSSR